MAVELQLPFCNFKKNMILEWRLKTLSWDKMEKSELKRELIKINDEVNDLWRSL